MRMKQATIFMICLLTTATLLAGTGTGISAAGSLTSLPPDAPVLDTPADGSTDLADTVTVSWHARDHAATFRLQLSATPDFSTLLIDESSISDTAFKVTGLDHDSSYSWRVCASNVAGAGDFSTAWSFRTSKPVATEWHTTGIPERYALLPAYPNPFNPGTIITCQLPEAAELTLVIYNSRGQTVRELASGQRQAGIYRVTWDGRDDRGLPVTSGLYLCHLKSGKRMFTQKLLLMR